MNRTIRTVLILVIAGASGMPPLAAQPVPGPGFVVLPFENRSSFEGPWDLGLEVPRYLSAYLTTRYGSLVVAPQVVLSRVAEQGLGTGALSDPKFWKQLRDELNVRFLLVGAVSDFDVSRFTTGSETLGAYEAFKGAAAVSFTVYDLTRIPGSLPAAERSHGIVRGEFADRSFALTLFGKQSQRTVEYRELNRIKFGSEEFNATVIGQACRQLAHNLTVQLETDLPFLRSRELWTDDTTAWTAPSDTTDIIFRGRVVRGALIYLEGDDAFISLGDLDGVQKGQMVTVFAEKEPGISPGSEVKVGLLEITQVRGPHLSLAKIRTGKENLKQKMEVRARVIE